MSLGPIETLKALGVAVAHRCADLLRSQMMSPCGTRHYSTNVVLMSGTCSISTVLRCIINISPISQPTLPMTLESDIEVARHNTSDTQTLYREVCALLFFRYGETPTANRLYQLVRKGSMSAPAKALRDFWADVRDKTRVDVGRPDLPPEVAAAAGEFAARMWRLSSDAATAAFDVFRQDAEGQIAAAREQAEQQDKQRQQAVDKANQAADDAAALRVRIAGLEARIVELQTANDMLTTQLAASKEEITAATAALADARRDFADELAKLRRSHEQNEQRLAAAEKRALLEIDSERATAQRLRKELQASRERAATLEAQSRAEHDALRDELAESKGELAAANARHAAIRAQLAEKDELLADREAATDRLRERIDMLSRRIETARTNNTSARPARRTREKSPAQGRATAVFSGAAFVKRSTTPGTRED
ncbi:DNA-binding protein [Paraburkholderia sp. MMS20-SJTN17]|uniref:DNA-binding protein n=1 Tax=Paraburkholderia translucens TaxID=2886945 RepID=A0ABS8KJD6_9BURK|nr:DNA-binding protein [Paraburkholderia sp. MMS20-SJTN17]MCC8404896.1 DNA-binding protein [Paraburkholderia sp. MMS20-SJTN17]